MVKLSYKSESSTRHARRISSNSFVLHVLRAPVYGCYLVFTLCSSLFYRTTVKPCTFSRSHQPNSNVERIDQPTLLFRSDKMYTGTSKSLKELQSGASQPVFHLEFGVCRGEVLLNQCKRPVFSSHPTALIYGRCFPTGDTRWNTDSNDGICNEPVDQALIQWNPLPNKRYARKGGGLVLVSPNSKVLLAWFPRNQCF